MKSIKYSICLITLILSGIITGASVNFTATAIRDVAKALSVAHNANIIVDHDIDTKVTIFLQDVELKQILDAITKTYSLSWVIEGNIYRIRNAVEEQFFDIVFENDTIKRLAAQNVKVRDFIDEASRRMNISILADKGIKGKITASLSNISSREGLKACFEANGFLFQKKGEVFVVETDPRKSDDTKLKTPGSDTYKKFFIEFDEGKISLTAAGADLGDLLKGIAQETGCAYIFYDKITGTADASLFSLPIKEVVDRLLAGTRYTYTFDNNILLVGEKNAATPSGEALAGSKLIHLRYIKAENIPSLLPKTVASSNVQLVKEQNGILVMGTQMVIKQMEDFVKEIDIPTPQVSIEAIIVEYYTDFIKDHGLKAKVKSNSDTSSVGGALLPGIAFSLGGAVLEKNTGFRFGSIGLLPSNFLMTLKALETNKLAQVLARPKIVTLNGSKASINVGTSMYYKITTGNVETPLTRFEEINSGIRLDITPWISKSGQITADVSPEVSSAGALNFENYPDVSRRSMTTTVRLNDGETIAIGGLIKSEDRETIERVPIISRIPLIGWFFRSTVNNKIKSELVVYITPHILTDSDNIDISAELKKIEARSVISKESVPVDSTESSNE